MTEIIVEKKFIYKKISLILKQSIDNILLEKKELVLALPGGRSITPILNELIKEEIPWKKIHVFMVDERLVPISDTESNFRLINEVLKKNIPKENLHPFVYNKKSKDSGIKKYENEIKKYGGNYDIILISAGEDGHIGALYPNHLSILDNSEYYIYIDNSPKPPPKRMSSSRKMLSRSNIGILVFSGEIKKDSLMKFLNKNIDYINCPAKIVTKIPKSYIITDIKIGEIEI